MPYKFIESQRAWQRENQRKKKGYKRRIYSVKAIGKRMKEAVKGQVN